MIFGDLSPTQKEAVNILDGPLLILAGAGSGKTKVLTHRIAHLIHKQLCSPYQILAVTFTNKAARNMKTRALDLLSSFDLDINQHMWIDTFHSSCVRILRQHINLLGYETSFAIYDSSDQLRMISKILNMLNINEKIYSPKSFQYQINSAKRMAKNPDDLEVNTRNLVDKRAVQVYKTYNEEMCKVNALDFDDLLFKTLDLFNHYPDILDEYRGKFKYILVDEYQDTNHIQYLLVKKLAALHKNICVVGDEDQSIYSWRGADIQNILSFEQDFPDARVVKLEQNYRSTQTIVNAASSLIKKNSLRKDKTLFTNNDVGNKIQIKEIPSDYHEALFVAQCIEDMLSEGQASYSDFAIFYRINAQSRMIEEQLRSKGIPYTIIGGIKFYERKEIKDILAYLRLISNLSDDVALLRIVNIPARGIGKVTLEKIYQFANEHGISLFQAIVSATQGELNVGPEIRNKLLQFSELILKLKESSLNKEPLEIYHDVLDATQYMGFLKKQDPTQAGSRIENLEELDKAIEHFQKERGEEGTLQAFLEEIALISDVDNMKDNRNVITLMTLHVSKGLEFPYVFIVGMEEGMFPTAQSIDEGSLPIEEERRLAYVGMTRAKKELMISYACERRIWGATRHNPPSRFLSEIPKEFVNHHRIQKKPAFIDKYASRVLNKGTQSFDTHPNYESNLEDSELEKGTRVRHPHFGVGHICRVEGQGEDQKVSIIFEDNRLKKFVSKYARLEKL